jgi:hypothetical protein
LGALYALVARPRINQWGATDQEHQATWPGDELVAQPSFVWTNAITIRAHAAQVWPWLVQLGQGRGGLYSYDWLENLVQDATRLLVRCRGNSLTARLQGPVQFVMQRRMMLGIKQRAEGESAAACTDLARS